MKKKINVVDYDPIWASQFETLRAVLVQQVGAYIISIEHVGSTAVPGLKAKPIIDLDIVIEDDDQLLQMVIQRLAPLGYRHVGDLGVTGREAFKKQSSKTPDTGTHQDWFAHHLYLCKKGSVGLQNHLYLRDYLREHPAKVEEYGRLKQELANKYPYDIDAYIDGKTDFIIDILHRSGMQKEDRERIDQENRQQ